jgi:hypothetical protein
MTDAEWEEAYHAAWAAYYSPEQIRTILRRAAVNRLKYLKGILSTILWFNNMVPIEGVHPLEGGVLRMKHRRDRRHGLPLENPLVFYPRYAAETAVKVVRFWRAYRSCKVIYDEVRTAPDRLAYTDLAIAPPQANEFEALDLYHATSGGEAALARKRRDDAIRTQPSLAKAV